MANISDVTSKFFEKTKSSSIVTDGAKARCMYGENDAHVIGTCEGITLGSRRPVADTDIDFKEGNFGYCAKLTALQKAKGPTINEKELCIPCIKGKWTNTVKTISFNGSEAVTLDSTLKCEVAGHPEAITVVSVTTSKEDGFIEPENLQEFHERYYWSTLHNMYIDSKTGKPCQEATNWYEQDKIDRFSTGHVKNEQLEFYSEMLATGVHPVSGEKITDLERANAQMMVWILALEPAVNAAMLGVMTRPKTEKASGGDVQNPNVGVVQSRVNLAENPTRFSPSNKAGMKHVRDRHYNPSKNAGQFTIPESDLRNILQSKQVVNTPVKQLESGGFERIVNIGKNIGTVKPSLGGKATTWIKVITDKAGNIITTYPIPKP